MVVQQWEKSLALFERDIEELRQASQAILARPLLESARDKLRRQFTARIGDDNLAKMILRMWRENALCVEPRDEAEAHNEPSIICSLGIVK